jgi:hypothetical protein
MESVGYLIAIWNSLWHFWYILCQYGSFVVNLVYFSLFWYIVERKIWQPWARVMAGAVQ